jgi:hypothetical protein
VAAVGGAGAPPIPIEEILEVARYSVALAEAVRG